MSVRIETRLIKQTPGSLAEMIARTRRLLGEKTDEILQKQIDLGNDVYSITVDGKNAYSRDSIHFAKKNIRVSFQGGATAVAVDKAVRVLRAQLRQYYPFSNRRLRPSESYKNIQSEWVKAWLCERGKGAIQITTSKNVTLKENQYITVTVEIPSGQINPLPLANWIATRNGGKGMFERAARNVRSALKVSRTSGSLRVAAIRMSSPYTVQPLSDKKDRSGGGRHIPKSIAEQTNWVLVIEPRRNRGQILKG